jgi:hypothetical protein
MLFGHIQIAPVVHITGFILSAAVAGSHSYDYNSYRKHNYLSHLDDL